MALITVRDVSIIFEGVPAIENVSLQIERGDYLVLVGENGSGKSTLMRAMLGLLKPQIGTIEYGEGLKHSRIGYLPQQTRAQRDFPASVEEVIRSGCVGQMGFHPFLNAEMKKRVREKMKLLDIEDLKERSYRKLSGGQQQRVLLARALCAADSILFLDEPVTGLDSISMREMYEIIRDLNRNHGITVVMVSHDLRAVRKDVTKLLAIDHGVEYFGTPDGYRPD